MPPIHRRAPAHEAMRALISGYWVSQLLFVVAKLGIADLLAKGPLPVATIAKRAGAQAPFLRRALRALASVGVFAEDTAGRFRLTPLAQTLCSDRAGSLRDYALMLVDDYNWAAWGALEHALVDGGSPFEHVHGAPIFAYLHQHPDKERTFAAAMASVSGAENAAIARAYPFGKVAQLVDVGGAHGHLLATILRRYPKLRGVLYDQEQVVAAAERSGFITAPEIAGRCESRGGDFFAAVPAGADGYLMKFIMHDWDDETCLRILANCREAMAPGGRVLVVDHVVPPGNGPHRGKLMDINMMVLTGGLERTREEFRELFARAGLRLQRVYPTDCPLSILEAVMP
jgi:hypothetical protein